jgi:hypothetical protein
MEVERAQNKPVLFLFVLGLLAAKNIIQKKQEHILQIYI